MKNKNTKPNYFKTIISLDNIKEAYQEVMEKFYNPKTDTYTLGKLARGIDGDCFGIFQRGINKKFKQIQKELKNFEKPLPSVDLKIPKSSNPNKFRIISISALKEKIKHQAVSRVMIGKLEEIYSENLYSYREKRGAYLAMKEFRREILKSEEPLYIYKVDMKDYFDNLDHQILLDLMDKYFEDKQLTKLIHTLIKQRRLSSDGLVDSHKGVVQGIAISGDMANLYLADLDKEMQDKEEKYFRVGDDIVVLHKNRKKLEELANYIEDYLTKKRKLPINKEKTEILNPDESFVYLGYEIRDKNLKIAKRNCDKMKNKIRQKLNKKLTKNINRKKVDKSLLLHEILMLIFPQTRVPDHVMWLRYFLLSTDPSQIRQMDDFIEERIRLLFFGKKRNKNKNLLPLKVLRSFGYVSLIQIYYDITHGRKSFHDYVKKLTIKPKIKR
ncbi:reverse transcriptase domain-containing protein [Patescibacteria group bacterium]